ncbi:Variable outer membrane protein (plasmid) [Borrelia crocidurae DOU]|uniref:Variable large protein n=1 Tax=Borrelia crocidurae DOU TaxID=1293575 RepID=W5SSB5_9SPIR|nr:Variable outer membrane protein [Borrelia crocidurae DOU]
MQAMIKDNGYAYKLANTNPTAAVAGFTSPKHATIAGAIALRAMAKDGKFSNSNAADDIVTSVKGTSSKCSS